VRSFILTSSQTVAEIALPVAMSKPLYYRIPDALSGQVVPGKRVSVPLRGRKAFGIVLDLPAPDAREALPPGMKLRDIEAVDPAQTLLSPIMLRLVKWISRYYVAPLGIAFESAIPRSIARPPRGLFAKDGTLAASDDLQTPALELPPLTPKFKLNCDQKVAVERVIAAIDEGTGETFLLQGVTGSGKTEVYLHAVEAALALGMGVLFLVPEIALGTQVIRRVRERFGDVVAEYHSQLKPAVRRRAWWDCWTGKARIVAGARSAVFAPIHNLGLVVVDEEHEPSYKQAETPRYHGRDTALMRARLEGAVTLLGSATPSLESSRNADEGKYYRLVLPTRADGRPHPTVTLIDLRSSVEEESSNFEGLTVIGGGERDPKEPLTPALLERLEKVVAAGEQAILFLNRRGFSTSVQCRDCGYVYECPQCSVTLTHHRVVRHLRCHYCNYVVTEVAECPKCKGANFSFSGAGTQRIEASLGYHLPEARICRMDFDSTRKRGALSEMIESFEKGEADILLGTQMVAKGFDFPKVTFVGVINADREMGFPDFRGQERAFQLLTQVAGRAARGDALGDVYFQTYQPDHHVISAAGLQDYNQFYELEMRERKPLGYPPHKRMANLLFDGPDEEEVIRVANREADELYDKAGITVLGPAPMPLSRLKGQFRWHLTLISEATSQLTAVLNTIFHRHQQAPGRRVRIQVDMDPVSML
jgi:primosomal protein N' (replication factor Y) (superfamily II helicase)